MSAILLLCHQSKYSVSVKIELWTSHTFILHSPNKLNFVQLFFTLVYFYFANTTFNCNDITQQGLTKRKIQNFSGWEAYEKTI